ncbi:MAG: DUF1570 domain-containing protein [Gemmatales bacterium]|nr:DUF1570 domain-containing protein [Gemmatales bacterium]
MSLLLMLAYGWSQEWPLDVIHLRNGHSFQGVILRETNDSVYFRQVIRLPGKPTYLLDAIFFREEIARIERIEEAMRQSWMIKLEKLELRGVHDKRRREALRLERRPEGAWFYRGERFAIVSYLSNEELTRRVIVRLEDMFVALREYLGERTKVTKILTIYLYRDMTSYQQALKERGLGVANPAIYIPSRAEILIVTDWEQLAEQLSSLRAKHEAQLRDLDRYEAELRRHYHGHPPAGVMEKIKIARWQLLRINQENEVILERQLQPLFRRCYHEGFHAYLDIYLYPQGSHNVPRWLNEGLAQIFETAIVETGDIHIGHIDAQRLHQVQQLLKQGSLPTIRDLLRSEPRHFQVNHSSEIYASDRYFLASWAATYFLVFSSQAKGSGKNSGSLSGPALMRFIDDLASSENPKKVLEALTGKSLDELESDWQLYFLRLRPDGTLRAL